jgi:GTPase SAR1 family protein
MNEQEKKEMVNKFIIYDEVFISKLNRIYNNIENILEQIKDETLQFIFKYEDKEDDELYILAAGKVKELKEKYLKSFVKHEEKKQEEEVKKEGHQRTIFFEGISE